MPTRWRSSAGAYEALPYNWEGAAMISIKFVSESITLLVQARRSIAHKSETQMSPLSVLDRSMFDLLTQSSFIYPDRVTGMRSTATD